jgi:hypothetical protein
MKDFDTLVIIGDSFCSDRNNNDWPTLLGELTGCTVKGKGFGGASWWSAKKHLETVDHIKSKTVLIICHTESSRLPTDYDLPICYKLAQKIDSFNKLDGKFHQRQVDSLKFANAFYESDLFSPDFYNWAHRAWANEINADSEYYAIINILSIGTNDTLKEVENKNIVVYPFGKLENKSFSNFHSLSLLSQCESNFDPVVLENAIDQRANHFSKANNINLANALLPIVATLKRHDKGIRRFNNLRDWDLDHNGILRYVAKYIDKH